METEVFLGSINDVKTFVNIVNRYNCDVDMVSGRYTIDAKSIMGIFSLDLTKPITLKTSDSEEAKALIKELDKFIVA